MGNPTQSTIIQNSAITNQVGITITNQAGLNQAILPLQVNQNPSLGDAILLNAILPHCCSQAPAEEIPAPIVPIEVRKYEAPVVPQLPPIELTAKSKPEPAKPRGHHRTRHHHTTKPRRRCVEWETKK